MEGLPPDPYLTLGVAKDASAADIKRQHRKLALKCHPDKVEDETLKQKAADEFHLIQTAYELISDEDRRARYDAQCRLAELRKEVARGAPRDTKARTAAYSVPTTSPRGGDFYARGPERYSRVSPQYEERRPSYKREDYFDLPRPNSRKYDDYERPSKEDERSSRKERSRRAEADTRRTRERIRQRKAVYSPGEIDSDSDSNPRERISGRKQAEDERVKSQKAKDGSFDRVKWQKREDERKRALEEYHRKRKILNDQRNGTSTSDTSSSSLPARKLDSNTVFYDLRLNGELDGRKVATFPDKGAGWNFLSQAYVQREGLQIDPLDTITVRMANGKPVRSLGSIKLPFRFEGGTEEHRLDFHVLSKCISDIILGDAFLKITNAFTKFANCIHRTLRHILPHRVCFLGGKQNRLGGWLNGMFVGALPDTGSDLMLMSRSYARKRGFIIDDNPEFNILLQMGDLSTTHTSGYVENVEWTFGDLDGNEFGMTQQCGFWILDDLACDVVFSDEFLVRTSALEEMMHCEYEFTADLLSLNAIKAVQVRTNKKSRPQPTALEEWNKQAQKERIYQSDVESDIKRLPADEQRRMKEELQRRWQDLEAQRPDPASPSTTAQTRPSNQHKGSAGQRSGLTNSVLYSGPIPGAPRDNRPGQYISQMNGQGRPVGHQEKSNLRIPLNSPGTSPPIPPGHVRPPTPIPDSDLFGAGNTTTPRRRSFATRAT